MIWLDCILTPLGKRTFLMKSAGGYKSHLLELYTWGFGPSSGEIGSMRLRSRAHQLDAVHQPQPIPWRNFQCRLLSFRPGSCSRLFFFPPVALKKMIRNMLAQNLKLIRQEGVGYESHSRMGRGMGESDPLPPEGSMWEIVLTAGGYKSVGSLGATPKAPGV